MGRVSQNAQGRLQFTYTEEWLQSPAAYPLSLSMPLQAAPHSHAKIEAFLWRLLPDNASILRSWGQRFQVSARNPFALLSHVGEDCAGAVQFLRPERLEELQTQRRADVAWLSEKEVGARLRELRADHAAWRTNRDTGQFSLAGAQPKTALLLENGRWGVPSGRTPTTHILKPPSTQLDGFPEIEHICLQLARAVGLPAAESRIMHFDGEPTIVVTRYDRAYTRSGWTRIHQEDLCQALGTPPERKYQCEGGPGPRPIVEILRNYSSAADRDVETFIDALALSWLIASTDGHAKNYSLLIAANGQVRLAPLYDIASVLPYPRFDITRVTLAMKIGDTYRLQKIDLREWRKLCTELKLDADALVSQFIRMAQTIPGHLDEIREHTTATGLKHPIIDRLVTRLAARSRLCAAALRQL